MTRLALRLLFVVALVGAVSACDSGNGGDPDPVDVAGVYNVTTFSFDPDIQILPTVNVQDTLVAGQTTLEIFESGQVLFRYKRLGTDSRERLLTGEASVRREQVRITFDDASAEFRPRVLLPKQITFDREGSTLTSETEATVNLSQYSPRYRDSDGTFNSVRGTLSLTLTPRG